MKTCTVDAGCCLLTAVLLPMGQDWVVCISGGKAHIGSVTVAGQEDALHTVVFPQHKDNLIGDNMALKLQAACGNRVAVVCGIHIDHATAEQLRMILAAGDELCSRVAQMLAE